jgi:outer membrane protein OmpA-like peptidoglycan-associated protein
VKNMFGSSTRIVCLLITAAALTGCGAPSEISRSATVLQIPQAESLSVVARQFQNDVPYTINFGFDEDWLDAEATARLDAQATWIIDNANVKFRVYGHADRVGSTEYNIDLGLRRATTAVAYLINKGISEERLEAMVSFGEDAPAIETLNRERANRRVVTEVFGFIDTKPSGVARNGPTTISFADTIPTKTPDDPTSGNEPTPSEDQTSTGDDTPSTDGKNPNSGRGNGDEDGDPGKSQDHNKGGDEAPNN